MWGSQPSDMPRWHPSLASPEVVNQAVQLLGAELRRIRQEAGLTLKEVAESMDWSLTKVSRIETGARRINIGDLKALLRLYGISDTDQVSELITIARAATYQDGEAPAEMRFEFVGELWKTLSQDDFQNAIEAQLTPANLILPPISLPQPETREAHFDSNESFWKKILEEEIRANSTIFLENFFLFEWFPRSPGLFHTKRGSDARIEAERHRRLQTGQLLDIPELNSAPIYDRTEVRFPGEKANPGEYLGEWPCGPTYDISGKIKMLEGGYGCIRLKPKPTENGYLWFMSASSTQSAHEGVPVALNEQTYDRWIGYIVAHGALPCKLVGKLKFLPRPLLSLYDDYVEVPGLYLLVEEIRPPAPDIKLPGGVPIVSVAVTFESKRSTKCSAAYVSFVPGMKGSLRLRIEWLEQYIRTYGGPIVTDFDEHMRHFSDAAFSLSKVCNGHLKESEITPVITNNLYIRSAAIENLIHHQRILNDYRASIGRVHVEGDRIDAGPGAVVINRSSFNNAVVSVGQTVDAETVSALKQIAKFIDRSGNRDAIEIFNEFNNQLQQPEPNKSVLRSLWNGIVNTLPNIASLADATAKIVALIH